MSTQSVFTLTNKAFVFTIFALFVFCDHSIANEQTVVRINNTQVTKDIKFLSSDELGGRASFSEGIDIAADYIEKRFEKIGLTPMTGSDNFKQTFQIYRIKPESFQISIEGNSLKAEEIMVLTSHKNIIWTQKTGVDVRYISEQDDFRKTFSSINRDSDKDTLIVVSKTHAELFANYHNHFSKGVTRFTKDEGPSAVIVLSDIKSAKSFSVNATTTVESRLLTNVVGILPGRNKMAKENVLFSAHYDHIGTDTSLSGDVIFNGADDDASGTTAVLNLAEYFAKRNDNQRTLMFVAFTAEEIGGYGSKYFSQQVSPETIAAMINIEMIGKVSKFGPGTLWMTGFDRSNLAEIMNSSLKGAQIHSDPYPKQRLFYRSDNATLARMGVPAHSFSSSQIDTDPHYHKVTDEFSTLDIDSMSKVIETLARAAAPLANGSRTPTRVDTSQVQHAGAFY